MDFETVIKTLVGTTFAVAIPIAAYAAIAAIRGIWGKPQEPAESAELEDLRNRVRDLEAMQGRMAELEERVDFTERLLSRQRDAARLAEGTE